MRGYLVHEIVRVIKARNGWTLKDIAGKSVLSLSAVLRATNTLDMLTTTAVRLLKGCGYKIVAIPEWMEVPEEGFELRAVTEVDRKREAMRKEAFQERKQRRLMEWAEAMPEGEPYRRYVRKPPRERIFDEDGKRIRHTVRNNYKDKGQVLSIYDPVEIHEDTEEEPEEWREPIRAEDWTPPED